MVSADLVVEKRCCECCTAAKKHRMHAIKYILDQQLINL